MPDREKVINCLRLCDGRAVYAGRGCEECSYLDKTGSGEECIEHLHADALTLLRGQEAEEPKVSEYTDIVDGLQIRDVNYLGLPPKGTPPKFDIVKHCDLEEPREVIDGRTGERKMSTHFVYSVAFLEWDAHNEWWQFKSVGTRWLEAKPTEAAVNMILKFCEEKAKEMEAEP